jgi:hypothetical protein
MNDERPIEKLLRRAAKKRRDEAGPLPDLHPANRRVLQDEVARQFPKQDTTKQSALAEFWAGLTQRWLYALGIFLVLAVAAIVILPTVSKSKGQKNFAQSAPAENQFNMELAKNAAAEPEPVTVTAMVLESDRNLSLSHSGGGNFMPPAVASAPVATPTPHFDRQISDRRSPGTDTAATFADSTTTSGAFDSTARTEGAARLMVTDDSIDTVNRPPPASLTTRAQPTRSARFSGSSGSISGSPALIEATSKAKTEADEPAAELGTEKKAFDSVKSPTIVQSGVVTTESATGALGDKNRLARGGGAERERAIRNSQAFSNLSAEEPMQTRIKAAPALKDLVPVLVNFKIEQEGRQMQVIDGDGSVYRGVVDEENTLYKQVVTQKEQKLSAAYDNNLKFQSPKLGSQVANKSEAASYYFYRVEGTNRSLNQNVVFTWNFIPTNEAIAAAQLNYKEVLQKTDETKLPSQFPALLQNSFINGRAQFGEGREVEVNAVPVKPAGH